MQLEAPPHASDLSPGRRRLWSALLLVLPFLFLSWLMPFRSDWTLGQDYPRFATPQQQELLFSLETGSFPLYVPGFCGGRTASALTLGQIYHPLAHLAGAAPGYWDGQALEWNTFFRLLSLGVAHLLLFRLLLRLRLGPLLALGLSTVTVYNLRMLNSFHIGAALECYTGFLIASVSVLWCGLEPRRWLPRVGVIAATYLVLAGGHPQFAYYGLLGVVVVTLVAPAFLRSVAGEGEAPRSAPHFVARIAVLGALGVCLAAAYWLPFWREFLTDNVDRVDQDYEWALTYGDTFAGTLASFFQPLFGATSTAFGGTSLWLVAALVPLLVLFRVRVPGFAWALWGVALLVFLHAQGDRTPVHRLLWEHLPMAGSVRGPGRMTFVMPVVLLLVLVWLARAAPVPLRGLPFGRAGRCWVAPLSLASLAALAATLAVVFLSGDVEPVKNAPASFNEIGQPTHALVLAAGLVTLVALFLLGESRVGEGSDAGARARARLRLAAGVVLVVAVSVQAFTCLRFGTWVTRKPRTPTLAEMRADKRERLDFRPHPGRGLGSAVVMHQLERSCLEPRLGRLYRDHVVAADLAEAEAILDRGRDPDVVVVVGEPPAVPAARATDSGEAASDDGVELVYSSFNQLEFEVRASRPGFFGFGQPYSPAWRATVNGESARVYRANVAAHAVLVPAGASRVRFRYWSEASFWGMLLSCATLAAVGAWISWRALSAAPRPARFAAVAALLLAAGGTFVAWRRSLYAGDDLETAYAWTPGPPPPRRNLAYGRPTQMPPAPIGVRFEERYGAPRAVDGVRDPGTGFDRAGMERRTWSVDLGEARPLAEVVLYGGEHAGEQIAVEVSMTGASWRQVALKTLRGRVSRLKLEGEPEASHVRLLLGGPGRFALDEVEVYGADEAPPR